MEYAVFAFLLVNLFGIMSIPILQSFLAKEQRQRARRARDVLAGWDSGRDQGPLPLRRPTYNRQSEQAMNDALERLRRALPGGTNPSAARTEKINWREEGF